MLTARPYIERKRRRELSMPTSSAAPAINGKLVDEQSRCYHWHSPLDVIALKFKCCEKYYACYSCHHELANHPTQRYDLSIDSNEKLIICGVCKTELCFNEYHEHMKCPHCKSQFNPACSLHYDLYFENAGERTIDRNLCILDNEIIKE